MENIKDIAELLGLSLTIGLMGVLIWGFTLVLKPDLDDDKKNNKPVI